ncbi:RHS repeat domain-containing protein [Streptomyces sp. NPDC002688]|uniref:RHS repeat domain-containing protein n=1 Tax=Streptomyces sp. NPDC002688 TaxID=3154423 RepID=UPI0033236E44
MRVTKPSGSVSWTGRPNASRSKCVDATVTGEDGAQWRREYDERGNLTHVTAPDGVMTRYDYNASGHLTNVTEDALCS